MVNNSIDTLNNDYKMLNDSVKLLTKNDETNKKLIMFLKNKNEELETKVKNLTKIITFGFGLTLGMSLVILILN
jgi:peptidoglycan hydrolase CwlO-like protein